MKRTKRSSPFKISAKAYIDKAQERNVPGLFLAGSFGKQGIAAENAGQTRAAAAEGETDGEFWRFNQQRMLVPHILKKLPKNEKNSYTVHQCTVHNRSRENQEKASEWLNGRET
ncbi:MAG: hypothetical protein ACLR7Y_07205 [Dysosmobacter sp.]